VGSLLFTAFTDGLLCWDVIPVHVPKRFGPVRDIVLIPRERLWIEAGFPVKAGMRRLGTFFIRRKLDICVGDDRSWGTVTYLQSNITIFCSPTTSYFLN
jgi:hypothetical protein